MEKYIIFEGVINQEATYKLVNSILQANNPEMGVSKIIILFSSLGGSIYEGFLLSTVIQNSKVPILMHATNHIDSIANVIFMSARQRSAESYAKFYMHGASTAQGAFDEKMLRDQLSSIKTSNSRIANFISENSNIKLKKVSSMMEIGTTISAHEALNFKILNSIQHIEVPTSAIRDEIIYVN
jgi:ATP-dependent protease ClpP protease subunit